VRKAPPVRSELKGHHDTGNHTHTERHREHLQPEVEDAPVYFISGREPHTLDCGKPRSQTDREGRKNNVEADYETKLYAR
jgi:hypothetical protein